MDTLLKTEHEISITQQTMLRLILTVAIIFAVWYLFHFLYKQI